MTPDPSAKCMSRLEATSTYSTNTNISTTRVRAITVITVTTITGTTVIISFCDVIVIRIYCLTILWVYVPECVVISKM